MLKRLSYLSLFVCLISYAGVSNATETKKTQNEQLTWVTDFLKKHITCSIVYSKVSITSDGRIIGSDGNKNFTVSEGDKFSNQPDHHSSLFYTLKKISNNKINIEYESSFDHRSFGKDLITSDSGVVELSCTEQSNLPKPQ